MALPSCEECKAIYQGLLELVEISRQTKPGSDATPQQLGAWFDQRDKDEDYKKRVRPALSTLRRRFIEHQKLTGHNVLGGSIYHPPQGQDPGLLLTSTDGKFPKAPRP